MLITGNCDIEARDKVRALLISFANKLLPILHVFITKIFRFVMYSKTDT